MKKANLFTKRLNIILMSLFLANILFGQECPLSHETESVVQNKNLTDPTFCDLQSAFTDYGNEYYIPNSDDEIIIIPVNIHVMQKAGANPENFEDIPAHQNFFDDWINQYLSDKAFRNPGNSELCLGNITSAPLSVDSRIQFELKTVFFHQDDVGWNNNGKVYPNKYIENTYLTGSESYYDDLNIFLIEQREPCSGLGCDADGVGYGGHGGPNTKLYVIMNEIYTKWVASGNNNWISTGVLSHEIAHSFGLYHAENTSQQNLFDFECPSMEWDNNNACMGYNGQQNYLSPLQVAHMRRRLLTTWRKKFIKSNSYTYGQAPLVISSDTDFDDIVVWHGDIVIEDGASLTVTNTLYMNEGFKIIVESGGRLSVEENGKITSCCGFWDGVYAYGDLAFPQSNVSAQALVRVREGGIIENAENGIGIIDGAIGLFNNGVFINNKKAIDFSDYAPSNFSSIINCSFIVNTDYLDLANATDIRQMNMAFVRSIEIKNSSFSNTSGERAGVGIMSMDAGYEVHSDDETSDFRGWKYGINAKGGCSINTFDVNNTKFGQCDIGIFVETVDNFKTNDNSFTLCFNPASGSDTPKQEVGIMTDFCTGYDIAFNTFLGYNAGNSINNDQPIGIVIKDSGHEPNKVEVNDFTGCYIANLSNGDNRDLNFSGGLQYLCNTQSANINDIVIPSESSQFGISNFQGSTLQPAGNTFSSIPSSLSGKNILNQNFTGPQDYLKYYYQGNVAGEFPTYVSGTDRIIIFNTPGCRESFQGGGGPIDDGTIGIGIRGKSLNSPTNLASIENEYKNLLESMEGTNAAVDQKALFSKLKSDYYQVINQSLSAQVLSEKRNPLHYAELLSKKAVDESQYLKLALLMEQGNMSEANLILSTLSDDDLAFYSLYSEMSKKQLSWEQLPTDQVDVLTSIAEKGDLRSALVATNVLEYYYDREYSTPIVLPKGAAIWTTESSEDQSFLSIVPNPNAGKSTLHFDKLSSGNYQLINSVGQLQFSEKFQNTLEMPLDLSALDKGTYFLVVELSDGSVYKEKIITQ